MVKTASQLEARENASDRVGISFGFAFDWLSKRCETIHRAEVEQNQSNLESLAIVNWKLL